MNLNVVARKVADAQAEVDKLRKDLNIPDTMANAAGPTPLLTSRNLEELTSERMRHEADYQKELTLFQEFQSMDREKLKKALPTTEFIIGSS